MWPNVFDIINIVAVCMILRQTKIIMKKIPEKKKRDFATV